MSKPVIVVADFRKLEGEAGRNRQEFLNYIEKSGSGEIDLVTPVNMAVVSDLLFRPQTQCLVMAIDTVPPSLGAEIGTRVGRTLAQPKLEHAFWRALKEIALYRKVTANQNLGPLSQNDLTVLENLGLDVAKPHQDTPLVILTNNIGVNSAIEQMHVGPFTHVYNYPSLRAYIGKMGVKSWLNNIKLG